MQESLSGVRPPYLFFSCPHFAPCTCACVCLFVCVWLLRVSELISSDLVCVCALSLQVAHTEAFLQCVDMLSNTLSMSGLPDVEDAIQVRERVCVYLCVSVCLRVPVCVCSHVCVCVCVCVCVGVLCPPDLPNVEDAMQVRVCVCLSVCLCVCGQEHHDFLF
jgi:hypothetical protein